LGERLIGLSFSPDIVVDQIEQVEHTVNQE
jgi:hypothetical protein